MKEQPIIVQGAMSVETAELIGALTDAQEEPFGPWRCVRGRLFGHPVVIACRRDHISLVK